MNTVHVNASRSYDVLIGAGLLNTLGHHVSAISKAKKVCIVSETNVWPLYGERAKSSLTSAGLDVTEFIFPAVENVGGIGIFLPLAHCTRCGNKLNAYILASVREIEHSDNARIVIAVKSIHLLRIDKELRNGLPRFCYGVRPYNVILPCDVTAEDHLYVFVFICKLIPLGLKL